MHRRLNVLKPAVLAAIALVAVLGRPMPASAASIAAWDAGGINAFCGGFTCGIRFQVTNDLILDALGGFETAFTTSGTVGIWNAGGTLLRSAVITTADSLQAGYYYEAVAPLLLTGGGVYTIGIWTNDDFGTDATPSPINVNGNLSIQTGVFSPFGGGFAFPTIIDSRAFAGANFLSSAAVPEPGTLSLIGLGLISVARRTLRRRRAR